MWVESLAFVAREDRDHVTLEMVCGKGGYVSAIARDLGRVLGCFGHVVQLRRIWSGPFDAEDGIGFEELDALAGTPELDAYILPTEVALHDLPEARVAPEAAARLRNGNPAQVLSTTAEYGDTAWASDGGKVVAVGIYRAGMLHPARVFAA